MKKIMIIVEEMDSEKEVAGESVSTVHSFGSARKAEVLQQGDSLRMFRKRFFLHGMHVGYVYYGVSLFDSSSMDEEDVHNLINLALLKKQW